MRKAIITFFNCIQDSQEFGSDDEYMISRVFFSLEIDGEKHEKLYTDLKQTVGSDYETAQIEVGPPIKYDGKFNHVAFRDCAEKYYRACVGSGAWGINIQGGSNIRMQGNRFAKEIVCEFEIS